MRIGAVMMQKNEGALFTQWWKVNSLLFGIENLFVLDNDSTDEDTLARLSEARVNGVNVLTGFHDFTAKGRETSRIINGMRRDYEWLFPLDCDEFVALPRDGTFLGVEDIKAELARLKGNRMLRVSRWCFNIPGTTQGYFRQCSKVVVGKGRRVRLDRGFHRGGRGRKIAESLPKTAICYVHAHNRPFAQLLASSRVKLQHQLADFSEASLEKYEGKSHHLIRYFRMTEAEYLASLPKAEIDLTPVFAPAGIAVPFSGAGVSGRGELALELEKSDA